MVGLLEQVISIIINISFQLLLRVSELNLTRCQNGYGTAKFSFVLIKHNAMKVGEESVLFFKNTAWLNYGYDKCKEERKEDERQ